MAGFIAETDDVVAGLVGGAVLATRSAASLDRGRVTGDLPLGTLARVGSVAVLAGAAELPAAEIAIVALAVAACRSPTRCGCATRTSPSAPRSRCPSPSAPSPAPPSCRSRRPASR